jgi:hypothetical protein
VSNPWSEVAKKPKKKKVSLPQSYATATSLGKRSNPSTIAEETSSTNYSDDVRGQPRPPTHNEVSAASDDEQSVLHPSKAPVCDGTYRVTFRWKTKLDLFRISRQAEEMNEEIYELLGDLFDDDDGLLNKWQQTGTEERNCI